MEKIMKKSITLGIMCLALSTAQAAPTLSIGVIQESVKKPVNINTTIYSLNSSYSLPSGIRFGGTLQKAYTAGAEENRTELSTGYSKTLGRFTPYAEVLFGRRDLNRDMDYTAVSAGVRYELNDKVYTNARYRYRDSYKDDRSWKTDTYSIGLGTHINKTTSLEVGIASTDGDYESESVAFVLVNRF